MSRKTTIVLFSLATASLDGDVGVVANNIAKADRKKGSVPFILSVGIEILNTPTTIYNFMKNIFNSSPPDLGAPFPHTDPDHRHY